MEKPFITNLAGIFAEPTEEEINEMEKNFQEKEEMMFQYLEQEIVG